LQCWDGFEKKKKMEQLAVVKRRAWDRRDNEPAVTYAAFRTFLDLGPGRSLIAAAEKHAKANNKQLNTMQGQFSHASREYDWIDRASAYDSHFILIEEKKQEELANSKAGLWAKRREEVREDKFNLAKKMFKQAEEMLDFPNAQVTIIENGVSYNVAPAKWSDKSVAAALAKTACELTSDFNKVTVEVPRVGEGVPDLSKLSDDDLAKFRELLAKATVEEMAS
jgi:hypothetical protein